MKDVTAILKKLLRKQSGDLPVRWPACFVLSAGAILAPAGANTLLDAFGKAQVWDLNDPLVAVSWRHLMLFAGVLELFAAWLCLFTQKRNLSLVLVAWLAMAWLLYRAALWSVGCRHPWAFVGTLTSACNISPLLADEIIIAVTLYLLSGSTILIYLTQKDWKILTTKMELFKIHCPHCGGKTAFEIQWMGKIIPCPHCQSPIHLNKPSTPRLLT
jgi:hypothetical protein